MKQKMMSWILKNAEYEELHAYYWLHIVKQHEIHSFFQPGETLPFKVKIRRIRTAR